MAITNRQNFYFKTLSDELYIICETYEYSRGWGHRARIYYYNNKHYSFEKRITYYNRTWERFTYESMLYKIVREFFNTKKDAPERHFIEMQIKAIGDAKSKECQEWCEKMTKLYNNLSDSTKETLTNTLENNIIIFTNQNQVEMTLGLATLMDGIL